MLSNRLKTLLAALSLVLLVAPGAVAQETQGQDSQHMNHGAMQTGGDESPSSKAFAEVNAKMHQAMTMELTGNADVDFVKGMIPHHQGAIDMAKVVLAHGKDPEVRKLAEEIIGAQEKEIAWMRDWLAKNAK
ncbi:MAG: DUF305 domain-containing protein [Parvibaculaceae bacterium]